MLCGRDKAWEIFIRDGAFKSKSNAIRFPSGPGAFRNHTAPNKPGYLMDCDMDRHSKRISSRAMVPGFRSYLIQCNHTLCPLYTMPPDSYVGPNRQVEYFARVGCVGQSARLFYPLPIAAFCRYLDW